MVITSGIETSLKNIFTGVLVGAIAKDSPVLELKRDMLRQALPKFKEAFPFNAFQDEYAFFHEIIHTLKIKVFTKEQLTQVIQNNADRILQSPYIDMAKWANTIDNRPTTDEEKITAFEMNMQDLFVELSNAYVTLEEFESSIIIYREHYIQDMMMQTAQNMALILGENGYIEKKTRGRSTVYKGVADAQKYYNERQQLIRSMQEESRIKSTIVNAAWLEKRLLAAEEEDTASILDFGLDEIDEVIGKFRRSNMLGVLGPPKGGKTRTTAYLINRALESGLNVAVWPLEGTKEEWESMEIAALIRTTSGQSLDSKKILQKKYVEQEIKQLIVAAETRLSTDFNRGKLSFIEGTAYCEDFIDVLQAHYDNDNAFDIIVIDSLVNILSRTRKGKPERIGEAYMLLKDFIANKLQIQPIAILPAQLKQDAVDYLRSHPDETIDVTAGGESAETIRSPDEVIGVFSTKDERTGGKMKFYHVASRHSASFEDFYARCELGCCHYYSDSGLNT